MVLLISADSSTTDKVQTALQGEPIRILTATLDGNALAIASELEPNLVLLEPGDLGGQRFEICRALQHRPGVWHGPVVLISPPEHLSVRIKALECGAVDYISKPIEIPELIGRLRLHLRLQHALESLAEMHAAHLNALAGAQQFCMPKASELPEARFHVEFRQVHQAGGDFYDVLSLGDGAFDYMVADATGHDIDSTYWTMALKTLLLEYTSLLFQPVDTLYLLNRALLRLLPPGVFFTAIYARLNRALGRLELLNAAHPPAILVPRAGHARLIHQSADVLGSFPDASFSRVEVEVCPGDRIFLMSDGLADCWHEHGLGVAALCEELHVRRSADIKSAVITVFAEYLQKCSPIDDALLLGIEV